MGYLIGEAHHCASKLVRHTQRWRRRKVLALKYAAVQYAWRFTSTLEGGHQEEDSEYSLTVSGALGLVRIGGSFAPNIRLDPDHLTPLNVDVEHIFPHR